MTTLEEMNQNGWYVTELKTRANKLAAPLKSRPDDMRNAYVAWLAARDGIDPNEVKIALPEADISDAPEGCFRFREVPVYSVAWRDLQAKLKRQKLKLQYRIREIETEWQPLSSAIYKPMMGAFKADIGRGVVKFAEGYAI